jgi:hypothetical protein
MPRRPRLHLAGVPLHSVQRGHNREAYLLGEDDYLAYRVTGWVKPSKKAIVVTSH